MDRKIDGDSFGWSLNDCLQVSKMQAEFYPPKVDIILKNEIPTDFYIIVSGAVVSLHDNPLKTSIFLLYVNASPAAGCFGRQERNRTGLPLSYTLLFSLSLSHTLGVWQVVKKLGATDVAGELGVIFNIPQPFTMRSRRLSQVVKISHTHFTQIIQSNISDRRKIIRNFLQVFFYNSLSHHLSPSLSLSLHHHEGPCSSPPCSSSGDWNLKL